MNEPGLFFFFFVWFVVLMQKLSYDNCHTVLQAHDLNMVTFKYFLLQQYLLSLIVGII